MRKHFRSGLVASLRVVWQIRQPNSTSIFEFLKQALRFVVCCFVFLPFAF